MCIAFEIQVNMVQCTQLSKKSVYGVEIDEKLAEGTGSGCRLFCYDCLSACYAVNRIDHYNVSTRHGQRGLAGNVKT